MKSRGEGTEKTEMEERIEIEVETEIEAETEIEVERGKIEKTIETKIDQFVEEVLMRKEERSSSTMSARIRPWRISGNRWRSMEKLRTFIIPKKGLPFLPSPRRMKLRLVSLA